MMEDPAMSDTYFQQQDKQHEDRHDAVDSAHSMSNDHNDHHVHNPLGVANGNSNNSSGNFGSESEQMKIFVTNPNVTYHTRHARRIYVGGIPPNYSDEEELRNFFNKVISKGLGVENDNSYVISVYMNQKKCYAFVEFNSIELTTACLEMDGIIFKKVTLKIYRANEYRPELVPPTKFIKLDLSGWSYGLATGAGANGGNGGGNPGPSNNNNGSNHASRPQQGALGGMQNSNPQAWPVEEPPSPQGYQIDNVASLIQFTNIASMEPGSLVIVGFPFEAAQAPARSHGSPVRCMHRGVGAATAPACLRKCLTAYPYGAIYNAELGVDLSLLPIMDVGDVLAGQSRGETKALLSTTVSELLLRGSVPFLVGGSRDQTYFSAMGLVAASGVCVGVMNVSAQVDCKILDCPEFCAPSSSPTTMNGRVALSPNRSQNCYGRYVQFGAQGSQCNSDVAKSIVDRGGHIFWLHKDLRSTTTESIAVAQFNRALRNLDACVLHDQQRKGVNTAALRASYPQSYMMVSLDCGVLAGTFNPLAGSCHSSCGLTAEEVLEIAYIAGAHPNVALFELTEFRPEAESDSRLNAFLADVFYKFALGVATRTQQVRGGALGAGAAALTNGVSAISLAGTGTPVVIPAASVPYGRAAGVTAAGPAKRPLMPGAAPYVPESTGSRYQPSRDPAVILQQQQQQQQLLYQQQQAALGRVPYTPQQLQVQQQQQMQMQQSAQQQNRGQQQPQQQQQLSRMPSSAPFPVIAEGVLNNHNGNRMPQQQQATHQQQRVMNGNTAGGASYFGGRDEDNLSVASSNDYNNLHLMQQQQAGRMHQTNQGQNHNYGTQGSYIEDDASSYGGSIVSRNSILNKPSSIVTQPSNFLGLNLNQGQAQGANQGLNSSVDQNMFFSQQQAQQQAQQQPQQQIHQNQQRPGHGLGLQISAGLNGYNSSPSNQQQQQGAAPSGGLNSNFPSDYNPNKQWAAFGSASLTPTSIASQVTANAPFLYPQGGDWGAHNESRLSMISAGSTHTMPIPGMSNQNPGQNPGQGQVPNRSASLNEQSFGSLMAPQQQQQQQQFHHTSSLFSNNTGSSSSSHRGGLDFSSPYDDPMDKLIGVTNIGHIPSFDDPQHPSYQDDDD